MMRAEGLNHYTYILGMTLNQYRIDTEVHYLHYITKPIFNNIFFIVYKAEGLYTDLMPCNLLHEIFPYSHEYQIF